MDPCTHFYQSSGLVMSTSIDSYLFRAHNRASGLASVNLITDDDTASTASITKYDFSHTILEDGPPTWTSHKTVT